MKTRVDADSYPLDISLEIESRFFELDLDCPVTNAVEIADANPFAFEICSDLICGGATQTFVCWLRQPEIMYRSAPRAR